MGVDTGAFVGAAVGGDGLLLLERVGAAEGCGVGGGGDGFPIAQAPEAFNSKGGVSATFSLRFFHSISSEGTNERRTDSTTMATCASLLFAKNERRQNDTAKFLEFRNLVLY